MSAYREWFARMEADHADRMRYLRYLQYELSLEKRLAAVIVERNGFPVLSVVRIEDNWSMIVEVAYCNGCWWYATGGELVVEAVCPHTAADDVCEEFFSAH
ncbi:hypothetical protein [Actinomadura sp. 6N118]|uniref:hypothetical protein n=1 Tax=Actinomadura sp. 6N118 TaxID=3375151 RepID=UPI0037BB14B6